MIQNKLTRTLFFLLLILAFFTILYCGRPFLVPLAFGALLAMLFYPLYKKLLDWNVPKWVSVIMVALIFLLISTGISATLIYQGRSLVKDWPKISKELSEKQDKLENYMIQQIGIASQDRIDRMKEKFISNRKGAQNYIRRFFGSFFSFISGLFLTIFYMIFLLWEEKRLTRFMVRLTPESKRSETRKAIGETRQVAAQYLIGRLILIGVLCILYGVGFLIFGLNYAIPIAVLVAVLSIIPYLGNLLGALVVVAMALATGGNAQMMLGLLGTMLVAQVLESNILTPMIMGNQVNLNPLTTLAAVIGFSILWGVSGTILAIPFVGVVKKILDHIDGWEPFGFLLGAEEVKGGQ